MSHRLGWLSDERVRLVLLLALLASLVAYLVASGTGALGLFGGPGGDTVTLGNCPVAGVPSVADVSGGRLAGLRRDIRRVISFEHGLRPYELGLSTSLSAWTDAEPGTSSVLPRGPDNQGGYEMRWWLRNRDDLVVNAWVFADVSQAHDFLKRASSANCRTVSTAVATSLPRGGRNLQVAQPRGLCAGGPLSAAWAASVSGVGGGGRGRRQRLVRETKGGLLPGQRPRLRPSACRLRRLCNCRGRVMPATSRSAAVPAKRDQRRRRPPGSTCVPWRNCGEGGGSHHVGSRKAIDPPRRADCEGLPSELS